MSDRKKRDANLDLLREYPLDCVKLHCSVE